MERARLLIEQAEAIGEHLEDLQLLFTVLYGSTQSLIIRQSNGDALHELSSRSTVARTEARRRPLP